MDKVFIEALQVDAVIGVYDWEREIRQPLLLDLELEFDNRRPAASDAIAHTLDYTRVVAELRRLVAARHDQLLETLAEACAGMLLATFDAAAVRLRIDKPGAARALGCGRVGVEIQRRAQGES